MPLGLILAAAVVAMPPPEGVHPDERAAYQTMLTAKAREAERKYSGAPCDAAKVKGVSTQVLVSIADHPELLVWRERVKVTGCGRRSIQNINVSRSDGSPPWRMGNALPGDSLADITLQQSAYPSAVAKARVGIPESCQREDLGDLHIAARPGDVTMSMPGAGPPPSHRPDHPDVALPESAREVQDKLDLAHAWMEVWPLKFCGRDRTMDVLFIPLQDQSATLFVFLPLWESAGTPGAGAKAASSSAG